MKKLFTIIYLIAVSEFASAQFGVIDNSFGVNGIVKTPLSNDGGVYLQNILPLTNGKYIATGYSLITAKSYFTLAKYKNDGSVDSTFGTDGIVFTTIDSTNSNSYCSVLQSDGKIILGGDHQSTAGYAFSLVRYNADGSIDNSFGINGIVKQPVGGSSIDNYGMSVKVQTDNKIVFAGSAYNGSNKDYTVMRFNTDGTPDNSFGVNGIVVTDVGGDNDFCYDMAIQADGKIVLAGDIKESGEYRFNALRYNADGSIDNSFGTNGIATYEVNAGTGNDDNYGSAVLIQPDQKIIIGGKSYDGNGKRDFSILRLNTNGTLDTNFGTTGIILTDALPNEDLESGKSLSLQSDGKIILTGDVYSDSSRFVTLRYNANGSLDNTFGTNGIVTKKLVWYLFTIVLHQPLMQMEKF